MIPEVDAERGNDGGRADRQKQGAVAWRVKEVGKGKGGETGPSKEYGKGGERERQEGSMTKRDKTGESAVPYR